MTMKLVKTATALALGASLISTAVVSTDASAASKYKISKGKLVIAKTGKVAKGYVTYKSLVYKDGKKLTGLKGKTYYKAGKKATGTYKGAYYYKGAKKITTGTYKGAYYYKGVKKVTTGLYNGRYYKSGVKATGTYKGAYYVKGYKKVTTGVYNGAYYVKGYKKVTTGVYNGAYYVKGVKKVTTGYFDGFHYVAGVKIIDNGFYGKTLYINGKANTGLVLFEEKLFDGSALNKEVALFEEKLFDGAELNKGYKLYKENLYNNEKLNVGQVEFEGKLYQDAKLSKGLVTFVGEDKKELVYNDGELANGTFTVEGKEVTYKDGVLAPVVITKVEDLTKTNVTVNFKALAADVIDATIEVKNDKGEIVKVTPKTLFKGATSTTFDFAPAQSVSTELVGVWTVEGIEVDFASPLKVAAIIEAAKQESTLVFNDALEAGDIKNAKPAYFDDYKKLIILTDDKAPKTLADIQKIVDEVNAAKVAGAGKVAIVKAVQDAKDDELKLYSALENHFDRVNKAWVTEYATAINVAATVTESNAIAEFDKIQTAVDTMNDKQIGAEAGIKAATTAEQLTAIKAQIVKYGSVDAKGELSSANKKHLESITKKLAELNNSALLAAVKAAKTPTQFKEAVAKLAATVNDVKVLDFATFVEANENAYFEAAKTADLGTVEKVQTFITNVNKDEKLKAETEAALAPVVAINKAVSEAKLAEDVTLQGKFVEALKAAGIKEVSTDKANVAEYLKKAEAIKTATTTTKTTTIADAKVALETVQTEVNAANIAVVKAAATLANTEVSTANDNALLASLAVIGAKNVKAENVKGYAATLKEVADAKAVQTAIDTVNAGSTVEAAVKAINEATTATAVKAGLDTLVNNKQIPNYLTVVSSDRIFIAEQVLANRGEVKYTAETVATAVTAAITTQGKFITAVNDAKTVADLETALKAVDASAFTGTAIENNAIAEKFMANKKADHIYKTISEIRTAIAAAK